MFRVVGKVQGSNMKERWHSGYFLGKRAGSEDNLVMTSTGSVVRARAIREMHRPLLLADLDVIIGTPHDPIGTIRAGHRDEARGGELAEEVPEDAEAGSNPKRVQITKEAVNKFGGTPGCLKCRGVVSGDRTYQFVHHSPECRTRMEDLMRRDDQFARKVEAAEERQKKRIAEVLEKKDQEAAKRAEAARRDAARVPPEVVPPEVPPHDAQGDPGPQDPHGGPGVSSKRDSYGGGGLRPPGSRRLSVVTRSEGPRKRRTRRSSRKAVIPTWEYLSPQRRQRTRLESVRQLRQMRLSPGQGDLASRSWKAWMTAATNSMYVKYFLRRVFALWLVS